MKIYTTTELQAQFLKLGYVWPKFHMLGVRSKANLKNVFDDSFYLIQGGQVVLHATCTTNPGTYWLQNLLNKKGALVLKPGQYKDTWAIGVHKSYPALVQVRPVTCFRDGDLDDLAEEEGVLDTGLFGCNIHRANEKLVSKIIDRWSAGCQVINDPKMFNLVLEKCKTSGQKFFTYTLVKEF
jgi:hypothetical protein